MKMHLPKIDALDLRSSTGPLPGGGTYPVTRTAGAFKGTLGNWLTSRLMRSSEPRERQTIATRAQDLVANDPNAASIVDSMGMNIVGTGLIPQSRPNIKMLGWTEEDAKGYQEQAEWAFSVWSTEADARGGLPFWAIQFLSIISMMTNGEFLRVPVMLKKPHRTFSLALQCIDPLRMLTPCDMTMDPRVRDGIVLDAAGAPTNYLVACPPMDQASYLFDYSSLSSSSFRSVPARVAHRPGAFHVFMQKEDEQVRGVSILAPAMKFFRDLSDYLDFELVGAIVAASFPVFIESLDPARVAQMQLGAGLPGAPVQDSDDKNKYAEFAPGGVYYGNQNEKPHILKSDRPGDSFDPFVERILRATGSVAGLPYELVAKDFSKTNYSSARAALLEAWRVFGVYQKWLVDMFCQPVWEMVLEEAWLRGMITLPPGSPDWYDARPALTRATWIPPKRGHVDPLKEMSALVLGKEHNILTLAKILTEMGDDWEASLQQSAREKKIQDDSGISPPGAKAATSTTDEEEDGVDKKAAALALALRVLRETAVEEN